LLYANVRADCAREEKPNGIHYSVSTHHATHTTGARVLTRIRPRVFAPYDASTRSVVKPRYTLERRRMRPASNYYDKLHAGDTLTSTPANFAELIRQSRFMLFINFNFIYTLILSRRAQSRSINNRVSLIAAPVYDQDTTQIAEYDGGMYITPAFIASHQSSRASERDINCIAEKPHASYFNSINQRIKRKLLQMISVQHIIK